jgi:hypothetical protein
MQTPDPWIVTRIADSLKSHPMVTGAVTARLQALLQGQLSHRQLTQAELTKNAEALTKDMAPVAPGSEEPE